VYPTLSKHNKTEYKSKKLLFPHFLGKQTAKYFIHKSQAHDQEQTVTKTNKEKEEREREREMNFGQTWQRL
jgi:hypothetical protein